jgi:hypothetical protein
MSLTQNPHQVAVGYIVQLAGASAFAVGAVLSVHHAAIAVCFVGGALAVYVGRKIRQGL